MKPGGSVPYSQGLSNNPYPLYGRQLTSLINSVAYGTRRFNAVFTRTLQ